MADDIPVFKIPQSDENADWIKANRKSKQQDLLAGELAMRRLEQEREEKKRREETEGLE